MSVFDPLDEHNRSLQANVFPSDWKNPTPEGTYNLVVIGGGPAGLVCAAGAAGLGGKVALIEKSSLGGDCLNTGCVPSKALLRAARAAHQARGAGTFLGTEQETVSIDFPSVMERVRQLRAQISPVDSATRYRDELGVDVYLGEGRFTSRNTIATNGQELTFARAVIATGTHPVDLPIPGLHEGGVLNNETVFSLTELPARLAVIGAGPIGCELAQAFARFGSRVTLLEATDRILPREDPEATAIVAESLTRDGIDIRCQVEITEVANRNGEQILRVSGQEVSVDRILVGAGRAPNVDGMGLEEAGVEFSRNGVITNDFLQTTNKRVYAAGDVTLEDKFTHSADSSARLVLQNALFFGRKRISALTIPRCTYTDPEVAHIGLTPEQAEKQGLELQSFTQEFKHLDRAILDGETEGFVRIHVRRGTPRILGATVVGAHAGELAGELSLAITNGIGLHRIASTLHCYPTHAGAIRQVADAYQRTRLTPLVASLFRKFLAWQRR